MRLPVAVSLVVAASCATAPTVEQLKAADGHREVALALVHEADAAALAGNTTLQDAKYRDALRELLDVEKATPDALDADGRYLLGLVYFVGFRRHEESLANLGKAVALRQKERQEEFPEAENLMGTVLVDEGKAAEALPHFDKARTNLLYQTPYFAEQGMGEALYKLGRHDEAAQHFESALTAYPDLCGAYVKLAEVEIAKGDDARVQDTLGKFLERCDSDRLRAATGPRLIAPAYLELGKSKLRTNQKDGAVEAFKKCVTSFSGEPAAKECGTQLRALEPAP